MRRRVPLWAGILFPPGALVWGAWSLYKQVKSLAGRANALKADALEPRSSFPTLTTAAARHLRTAFADAGLDAFLPGFPAETDVCLGITERELTLETGGRESWIPLARVKDSAFLRTYEALDAPKGGALLSVVWERGGERLSTVFRIERWVEAEKVRQQLHMRTSGHFAQSAG